VTALRLSVVVPTLNRRDAVLRLLRALGRQSASPDSYEAVVVVDGSTDGTADAVERHDAPFAVRCVVQPQSGLAAARTAGARAAAADVLLFLDDDMEPTPGMIDAHLERHRAGAVLGVVGAAPIVVPPDAASIVRYRARGFARKLERLAGRRDELLFNDVYGGNFSIRRDTFLAAGGYDEAFRAYGHEDYELALRLQRLGGRFVFDQSASADQHYEKSFRQLAANVEAEGSTAVLFAIKHPEVLPSLMLGKYARHGRLARARIAARAALDRFDARLRDRIVARIERAEAAARPGSDAALFARYDRALERLYWAAAERALHERSAPRFTVAVRDVARWIRAAR
jgi:GT2 family glycosyltransferase